MNVEEYINDIGEKLYKRKAKIIDDFIIKFMKKHNLEINQIMLIEAPRGFIRPGKELITVVSIDEPSINDALMINLF